MPPPPPCSPLARAAGALVFAAPGEGRGGPAPLGRPAGPGAEGGGGGRNPEMIRTRHRAPNGAPLFVNRLIESASPYLRQHAHNPVDWRPWSEAAFAEAKARGVMVFLSIGYASCHWCHVMEEESFDDEAVAGLLNRDFLPVKLDREESPDIDAQYASAALLFSGRTGWPNNLLLVPDGAWPAMTFSYLRKDMLLRALQAALQEWGRPERRKIILQQAQQLGEAARDLTLKRPPPAPLSGETFDAAADGIARQSDPLHGGFGQGEKFPNEVVSRFLLDSAARRAGRTPALDAATTLLKAVLTGGVHDQIGGGFHRYAVDRDWRTPHFEKMLPTQALMIRSLLAAQALEPDPVYERAMKRTLAFVAREMTSPEGLFHTALDADSRDPSGKMEEGAYYLWRPQEAEAALGSMPESERRHVLSTLGLLTQPRLAGGVTPHLDPRARIDFPRLDPVLDRLLAARRGRPAPFVDDKALIGWNGLMIRALAEYSMAMDSPAEAALADRAAQILWARGRNPDGSLARGLMNGRPFGLGTVEDYAYLGLGFVALHDALRDARILSAAESLGDMMWKGAFHPDYGLLAAPAPLGPHIDARDMAAPSGNAAALELYALLSRRTSKPENHKRAETLSRALSGSIGQEAGAHTEAMTATRILHQGETGAMRALAQGRLTLWARRDGNLLKIDLEASPGWVWNDPPPTLIGRGIGPLRIEKHGISAPVTGPGVATLSLRLCGEGRCLPAETTSFRLG